MEIHLFPGQGSQYPGMSSELQADPWVAELMARAEAWSWSLLGCRFGGYLRAGCSPENDPIESFLCDQVRIFTGALAISHVLARHGALPHLRMGHSLGEIAALAAAGWMDADMALRLVCLRSRAIVEHAPPGGMVAVNACVNTVQRVLALGHSGRPLALSTVNGPSQVTVSGKDEDLRAFEQDLDARGLGFKRLHAKYPFHGPLMQHAAIAFARSIAAERFRSGAPVWSPILSRAYGIGDRIQELVAHHLVLPVMFSPSVEVVARAGSATWVEVGGRKALTGLARSVIAAAHLPLPRFLTTSLPGESERNQLLATIQVLFPRPLVPVESDTRAPSHPSVVAIAA